MAVRLHSLGAGEVIEAASRAEARARARSMPPDLATVDLRLPDGGGLDLLAELRGAGCTRLVVLSAADDPYSVRAAFVAGAQGYLLKTAGLGTITDGLRCVLDGGVYADPSIASLLAIGVRGGAARANAPPPNCPCASWRCCAWSLAAGPTDKSATSYAYRCSPSKAISSASAASSAPVIGPGSWPWPCAPA